MHFTAAASAALLVLLFWCCWGGGGGGGLRDVARCSRRVARGSRRDQFSLCQQSCVSAWSDTMCCGVPIVFGIWHAQFLWARWWHRLIVRNVSCKSSMLKCTMFCGVPIVFCSGRVDFTQVGRLHAEWVCPCGGLTSRGLGWVNPGAKYPKKTSHPRRRFRDLRGVRPALWAGHPAGAPAALPRRNGGRSPGGGGVVSHCPWAAGFDGDFAGEKTAKRYVSKRICIELYM